MRASAAVFGSTTERAVQAGNNPAILILGGLMQLK